MLIEGSGGVNMPVADIQPQTAAAANPQPAAEGGAPEPTDTVTVSGEPDHEEAPVPDVRGWLQTQEGYSDYIQSLPRDHPDRVALAHALHESGDLPNLIQTRGNPSESFVQNVAEALDRVPLETQREMQAAGIQVIAGGNITDGPFQPENTLQLATYGAYQLGQDVFVPEQGLRLVPGEKEPPDYEFYTMKGDRTFATLHEVGHALDEHRGEGGRLSEQAQYTDAFQQDYAGVSEAGEREKYRDPVEVYASLYAATLLAQTGYPDAEARRESERLMQLFPNAVQAMRASLGQRHSR